MIRGVGCLAGSGPRYVVGGTAFVLPFLETFERLSLSKIRLEVKTRKVFTARGVPISVVGIAEVRVQWSSQEGLEKAAEIFEGKSIDDIGLACLGVMEQHQREVLLAMTPEMIFINRNSFSENVINSTREDLENMGVELLSYVVSDIHSENKADILDQEN